MKSRHLTERREPAKGRPMHTNEERGDGRS